MIGRFGSFARNEKGQGVVPLIITIAAVAFAGFLLAKTLNTAISINKKADQIEKDATGIGGATKVIKQLNHTEEVGTSILNTSNPLVPKLTTIDNLGKSINGLATSIQSSVAVSIDSSVKGIGREVPDILSTLRSVNTTVSGISSLLDATKGILTNIQGDTGVIRASISNIHHNANRIETALNGPGADSH
jgi:uncharacterized protein YoxC